jgi:hypothetical protein
VARQHPKLNLTPLLLRDVEDLAAQAKTNKGKNAEGLFARATLIIAVIALDHFIDLYFDRISPESKKREIENKIKRLKRDRKINGAVPAKWYVVADFYTPSRFLPNIPPFSELKKLVSLRNRLVHLYQNQLRSRNRKGVPNLLTEVDWKMAEGARDTTKAMISAFYEMAYKSPPDWLNPESAAL